MSVEKIKTNIQQICHLMPWRNDMNPTKGRKRKRIWLKPLAIPTLEMKMQHHCYKCTYKCWEESTMKLHVSEKHKEIESSEIENLECKTCEVSFGAKDAFVDHMKQFHAVELELYEN